MAFRSKKLRVQLPCKKAGTLVEREIPTPWCEGPATPPVCDFSPPVTFCEISPPQCPGFRSPCFDFVSPHNCGFYSPGCLEWRTPACNRFRSPLCDRFGTEPPFHCPPATDPTIDPTIDPTVGCAATPVEIPVEQFTDDPETVLVHPDHLPELRLQLESELARITALEARKEAVEGQLKELDTAEKELKKKSRGK